MQTSIFGNPVNQLERKMIYDLGQLSVETEGDEYFVANNATVLGKVK